MTIKDYLKDVKKQYENRNEDSNKQFIFIMGNEAADLDSMASATVQAYHLQSQNKDSNVVYLPLINLPRSFIPSSRDREALFKEAGVDLSNILTLDEVDLESLREQKQLGLFLVDHNEMAVEQQKYAEQVLGIIDHHPEGSQKFPNSKKLGSTITTPVGSCASLVANQEGIRMEEEVAILLAGPIILDTRFEEGLLTDTDIAAFDKLSSLLPKTMQIEGGSTLESKFRELTADKSARIVEVFGEKSPFVALSNARSDVSGMDPAMLLGRDYKRFGFYIDGKEISYGMSSFTPAKSLNWDQKAVDNLQLEKEFQRFMKEQGVDFLVVGQFNCPESDKPTGRRTIIYCPDPELRSQIEKAMEKTGQENPKWDLKDEYTSGDTKGYTAGFAASRKVLKQPFEDTLRAALEPRKGMKMGGRR